jgi:hypothetical protein
MHIKSCVGCGQTFETERNRLICPACRGAGPFEDDTPTATGDELPERSWQDSRERFEADTWPGRVRKKPSK